MPYGKDPTTPPAQPGGYGKDPTTPPEPPSTSAGGIAGAVTRGLAPMAAGAGLGAAAGAPFAGVGAIPGAAAGAGAVGLTELASSIYNRIAPSFGWSKTATPQEMTDKLLDYLGMKRASTGSERMTEAVSGGAASALGPAKAAGLVADKAAGLTKSIAGRLAEKPGLQAISGAAGGASGQTAAELGAGPLGQAGAALVGGGVPYSTAGLRAAVNTEPRQAALEARQAGYVLPPAAISEKPGLVSNVLAGWSGKIKTQQSASANNQEVTNKLAAQALGIPPDTVLTDQVFENIRRNAGQAYQAVINSIPVVRADPAYDGVIAGLGGRNGQAAQIFPKITSNPGIKDLVDELRGVQQFPTGAGVELVKELRYNANGNLKAVGDPSKHALGLAQRQAADAVDELMERNIAATGQPGLIDNYRQARALIAKSYDVEGTTNIATGDVNARGLARLAARGRPLSGELDTIARVASAFPKATQAPAGFGHDEKLSALDFFGGTLGMLHGRPEVLGSVLARPIVRAGILSKPYQRAMTSAKTSAIPLPLLMNPGMEAIVPPGQDVMRRATQP